jgi:3-hydroxybutyrate dehydrogenase
MAIERRAAVVTGAGSGLGRALSLDMAQQGFSVLAGDIHLEMASETIALMDATNGSTAFELDVASAASVRNFAHRIADLPIDVLINNAGLQHVAPIDSFPGEKWQQMIDVMLGGAFAMTQAVLPGMRRRGFGRIINIGSIHSCIASPFKSAYVAAKHGLVGLAKVVALETADVDITVNTICPAYIRTPLVEAQIRDQAAVHGLPVEEVVDKILLEPMPKRAFITVEEIAGTVRFLLGPHARNITGQAIVIDGGWTIR